MTAKTLAILGSSSSAGKSLLTTALCHSFARRGVRVAPFKAQNMSNNAAVCPDGAEIGRAQALQARAAGIAPSADMNPILIKPEADAHSQVVVMGRPFKQLAAADYYTYKQTLWKYVTAALERLRAEYDLVIIEGAGSPVELNLKAGDIVNMPVAQYAQSPVLLVGDIDRGGIFAQLLGTLWLLEPEERALVRGLVVNKFRGDLALFAEGVRLLEEKSGTPVLGVIPYLYDLGLPEEDAVALDSAIYTANTQSEIDIAIIRLPLIANFDDFDPFRADPGVSVRYVTSVEEIDQPDAICLPGTKSTVADLNWLRQRGLDQALLSHARRGGAVVGICGGYQMLGQVIHDPQGIESGPGSYAGLGLLATETSFTGEKSTRQARAIVRGGAGWMETVSGMILHGYEIHMGRTSSRRPWLEIIRSAPSDSSSEGERTLDGAFSQDGRIWGCYLHGVFAEIGFRRAWLRSLGWRGDDNETTGDPERLRFEQALTRLTDTVETALDMKMLEAIIDGQ
jgi:adenosylcobyric acid synthase